MSATQTKGTVADWGRLFLTPGSFPVLASLPNPQKLDLLQIMDEDGDIVVNVNYLGVVQLFPSNVPGGGGTPAGAASPVYTQLGVAANYELLAAAGITNTGSTVITGGNIGSYPTPSITGFPPGVVTPPGTINNAGAQAAQAAALIAYNHYTGLSFTSLSASSANLSVLGNGSSPSTYTPGNYSAGTSMDIPTSITLDAQGNSNAVFVFKAGSTITLESGASVLLINGANPANVVWLPGSSFTSVATSVMNGNILANTSITLGGGVLNGRALAGIVTTSGAITIAAATAGTNPGGAGTPAIPGPGSTSKQCLFGRYYTRLGQVSTNTVAKYFADVFSENKTNQDVLQVTVQGGKSVYHLDHLGVAYYL
jgi:Ice-binding-like